MKKPYLYFTFLFLLVQLFSQAQYIKNGQIVKNIKGLNLIIDKRIEMISVIQYLAKSEMVNNDKYTYSNNVSKYFEPYKNHKVISLYKEMEALNFEYDVPVWAMLFLDANFKEVKKFDKELIERGTFGENRLKELVFQLQDFYEITNFDKFFKDNYTFLYKSIELVVDSSLNNFDEINTLEKFYGYGQNSYNIILSALELHGGYGVKMMAENGLYDIYDIIGPSGNMINDIAVFGNEQSFKGMAWHEFGHSFVNPLVNKYYKEFEKYKELQNPIATKMKSLNYDSWEFILNEHIIRAITAVFTNEKYGKDAAEQELDYDRSNGFIYIDSLYSKILTYSHYRKEANFKEFFPQLIEVMKSYTENPPIENKRIPGVNELGQGLNFILIYPTNESSDSLNHFIKMYVDTINQMFFKLPDDKIIPDTLAIKRNLKDFTIICYGSYKGNLWLNTKIKDLPFEIYDDKIIARQNINQTNLLIIASWINPDNPDKYVVIYTAQTAKQILHINRVNPGSNNYVIANKNGEIIEKGNYKYEGGKFIVK